MHRAPAVNRTARQSLLALALFAASLVTPSGRSRAAEPAPGPWHAGFAIGGLVFVTDYDGGFVHRHGRRISPEAGPAWTLRLGRHLGARVAVEAAVGHAPLLFDDQIGALVTYRGDLLVALRAAPITPYLVVGGGALHAFGGRDGPDLDGELHYGLELRGAVRGPIALRAGLRHVFSDALDAHLAASSHLEVMFGLDVCWGAP